MKLLNIKKLAVGCIMGGLLFASCKKEKEIAAPWVNAGTNSEFAHLRIVHSAPNFRAVTSQADSLYIFANNMKVNGTRLSYGGFYPSQTINSYAGVPSGDVDLKISVGGLVNLDSIAITSLKVKMEKGKFYSLVITDSILNGSRDSAKMFMTDNFAMPNPGRVAIRFVNSLVDTGIVQKVDVWSTRRNNYLYNNISTGTITAFSSQPYIALSDTLIVRRSGTMVELAKLNNITIADQRVVTFYLRGQANLATGAKARALSYFMNR